MAEDGDDVIFPRLYRPLCGIVTVDSRSGELVVDVLVHEVVDKCIGALVVELLETGAETAGDEEVENALIRKEDLVESPH